MRGGERERERDVTSVKSEAVGEYNIKGDTSRDLE